MTGIKKLVSLTLADALALCLLAIPAAWAEAPVKLTLLTTRQTAGTNDVEELWYFKYLEQKFNVDFELEQTFEDSRAQRLSLMFGSADLPDIIWGVNLTANQIQQWGADEQLLLAWNDYLNEETMPNAVQAMKDYPSAFVASTTPDGKIYTLPYIKGSKYYDNTGAYSRSVRVYVNTEWMEKCGMNEMPAQLDDVLEMLRAFKAEDPMGNGENNMPLVETGDKFKDYIWHCLGFYGNTGTQSYGNSFAIKNGEVRLPAYSEEARAFLSIWNAMYEENLFAHDTFTVDKATRRGWLSAGYAGIMADDTIQYAQDDWAKFVALPMTPSEYCDAPVAAMNRSYTIGGTYASAKTRYPELVAKIVDYMYSDEGATYYNYGPAKGSELEFGNVEGWYVGENNAITCDPVARGEVNAQSTYVDKMVSPCYYIGGRFDHTGDYINTLAGIESTTTYPVTIDALTGKELVSYVQKMPVDDNFSGHWSLVQVAAMQGKLTGIILPDVYLTTDEVQKVTDLSSVLVDYIKAESAKFITGARPLDEFDAYQQELRDMGVEEYIEIYANAYASFIDANY